MDPEQVNDNEQKNTEQLIDGMMSFLNEANESIEIEESDEVKNPICWAIKRIINIFPDSVGFDPAVQETANYPFHNQVPTKHIEKMCRNKDPYMSEVNRLMFCSTMGHPPSGTREYYKAAENYALFGKDFVDSPTDMKFPQPMDVSCFGDVSSIPAVRGQPLPPQGFGKSSSQLMPTTAPLQQFLVNQTNYSTYPFVQAQNLVQPLIYSNPFLMTQYLNTVVKETQINTSLVQQQQYLSGGIHERLVYAQMLQQQIQTNQAALMNSYFMGSSTSHGTNAKCKHDATKVTSTLASDSAKSDLDGGGDIDNNRPAEQ